MFEVGAALRLSSRTLFHLGEQPQWEQRASVCVPGRAELGVQTAERAGRGGCRALRRGRSQTLSPAAADATAALPRFAPPYSHRLARRSVAPRRTACASRCRTAPTPMLCCGRWRVSRAATAHIQHARESGRRRTHLVRLRHLLEHLLRLRFSCALVSVGMPLFPTRPTPGETPPTCPSQRCEWPWKHPRATLHACGAQNPKPQKQDGRHPLGFLGRVYHLQGF